MDFGSHVFVGHVSLLSECVVFLSLTKMADGQPDPRVQFKLEIRPGYSPVLDGILCWVGWLAGLGWLAGWLAWLRWLARWLGGPHMLSIRSLNFGFGF